MGNLSLLKRSFFCCCVVYFVVLLHCIANLWHQPYDVRGTAALEIGSGLADGPGATTDDGNISMSNIVLSRITFSSELDLSSQASNGTTNTSIPGNSFLPPCVHNTRLLLKAVPSSRQRLTFRCDVTGILVETEEVADGDGEAFTIKIDKQRACLRTFVKRYCYEDAKFSIPNVVHYVWFGKQNFTAHILVSVLSVLRFQKPCAILFHGDTPPQGPLWSLLLTLWPRVIHVFRVRPKKIFGRKLAYVQHQADILRLEVLKELGGIYLDTDQLLLRSVTSLRQEKVVMSHENKNNLANSLILSTPGARFLEVWTNQYRYYNSRQWGYHSTYVPWNLAQIFPDLITVVDNKFVNPDLTDIWKVYSGHYDIADNFALHLYTRTKAKTPLELSVMSRRNSTLGEVWRTILYGSKEIPKCA